MNRPKIAILGAGPAGVGAAFALGRKRAFDVTVIELRDCPGGNAGSFDLDGLRADYGSHRLHYACEPHILADLKELLGDDLLTRPRHGRIRLHGSWIRFPLRAADLATRLPKSFALGAAWDSLSKPLRPAPKTQNFATVLEQGLGPTICRDFYFPYARKIWGVPPAELSAEQAKRRVSAGSPGKLLKKLTAGASRFYYPRRGFGQISESLAEAAQRLGAKIRYGTRVSGLVLEKNRVTTVHVEHNGEFEQIEADHVWSTLPMTFAARLIYPQAPPAVLAAADALKFRSMILVYLTLETDQFSPWDAHYFPEESIQVSRISEPKNYSGTSEPSGRTLLCAELPCSPDDGVWSLSDDMLKILVCADLEKAGVSMAAPISNVTVRRLRFAYPIYNIGFEQAFQTVDNWLGSIEGFLSFGRQGLFAHDNTHHALAMASAAVECIDEAGTFDPTRWAMWRSVFDSYVVED